MTVFKGYLLEMKRNISNILMYFGIFMAIAILINVASDKDEIQGFSAEKVTILAVDLDQSALSKSVVQFLQENHDVSIEPADKAMLAEKLYYGTDVALWFEKGFEEKALEGEVGINLTNRPGSYSGIYLEQQINRFVGNALNYYTAGYSMEESCQKVSELKESKVLLDDINGNEGKTPRYAAFFQYLPYLLISVCCQVLGKIFFLFRKKEVKNRLMASAVPLAQQNGAAMLAFLAFGTVIYMICCVACMLMYGEAFLQSATCGWYLLNGFLNLLMSLELAMLIGLLVKKEEHVNIITTPLALGLSFLCGTFVPLSIMGTQIKNVARFLPVYWYETVNNLLVDHAELTGSVRTQVLTGIGVQALFLVALAGVALAVVKYQQQER